MTYRVSAVRERDLEVPAEPQLSAARSALDVQRAAGNAAVARLLGRSDSSGDEFRFAGADAAVRRTLARGGSPLDGGTRAAMEQELGADFGGVRVHADANAEESARLLHARAYTVGRHVVFAQGMFEPGARVGRMLLAHELAHAVQQSAVAPEVPAEGSTLRVEPAGSPAERAVDDGAAARVAVPVLQRQPTPQAEGQERAGESLFTVFVADEARKTDARFARTQALADSARIRKSGTLSREERQLVNAKLRFFEGDAWRIYGETIRPALIEVTREEIDMGERQEGPPGRLQPGDLTEQVRRLRALPEYVDNGITKVSYHTAELAVVHYRDNTTFELGLVPRWMKSPVVEVDYTTPAEQIRPVEDAAGRFGYMNEPELAQVPRTLPYQELLRMYVHWVDFFAQPGTGRVIPSRINMLTAPTLCGILRDSLRRYEEQVQVAVEVGLGGTMAIGPYAGQGGLPKGTGVTATSMFTRTAARVLSSTGRKLAREMDALLESGEVATLEAEGVEFIGVEVSRQGSTLAVKRYMSFASTPGKGIGYRMAKEFEEAAAEVGRLNGARKVTIDVGVIINENWQVILESRGYAKIAGELRWVKTIVID